MSARQLEHGKSQTLDIARRSSVSKPDGAAPVMHGMRSRSTSSVANPTSSSKKYAVPQIAHGMKSNPQRGHYDPSLASAMFAEATRSADDFAQDLHATVPQKV